MKDRKRERKEERKIIDRKKSMTMKEMKEIQDALVSDEGSDAACDH